MIYELIAVCSHEQRLMLIATHLKIKVLSWVNGGLSYDWLVILTDKVLIG